MARRQPADAVPTDLLERPDFVSACTRRDLGAILRLVKRWGGVGFTASHIARRCGLTVSRVQDYAGGRVQARQVEIFERVADGLRIPGSLLDLGVRPWEAASSEPTLSIAATTPGTEIRSSDNTDRVATTAALLWTPERAGVQHLSDLRANIKKLVSWDNQFGAADLSQLSEDLFNRVHKTVGTGAYERGIRTDLLAAAGELAEVAGWLAYDANRQDVVRRMNHEALYFTRLAGDRSMELLTLQNASMHAGFLNRPQEALDLAELVLSGDYRLSPRVRALFLTRKARALAQGGDTSALSLFAKIYSLYQDGTRDTDPHWAWWIDERELAWHEAMCQQNLGESRRAISQFERSVDATLPSETRSQYLHRAYLLAAQVRVRSWAAAETTMQELGPLAETVASTRTSRLIRHTLVKLAAEETCAPRQAVEHGQQLSRMLQASTSTLQE